MAGFTAANVKLEGDMGEEPTKTTKIKDDAAKQAAKVDYERAKDALESLSSGSKTLRRRYEMQLQRAKSKYEAYE